jgi:hypothetical protein
VVNLTRANQLRRRSPMQRRVGGDGKSAKRQLWSSLVGFVA